MLPPQRSAPPQTADLMPDPLPNPEPASPSLPAPDPGVFHHEPAATPSSPPKSESGTETP